MNNWFDIKRLRITIAVLAVLLVYLIFGQIPHTIKEVTKNSDLKNIQSQLKTGNGAGNNEFMKGYKSMHKKGDELRVDLSGWISKIADEERVKVIKIPEFKSAFVATKTIETDFFGVKGDYFSIVRFLNKVEKTASANSRVASIRLNTDDKKVREINLELILQTIYDEK